MLKAKSLTKGDTIGLLAPSGFVTEKQLLYSVNMISGMGFETFHTDIVKKKYGYLAGSDSERAQDMMKMFENKNIKGIFCIRGGFGAMRILDKLDYDIIRKNPKVFVGYSDITALLQAFYKFSGLVGFHGVVASSVFSEYTRNYFPEICFANTDKLSFDTKYRSVEIPATDTDIYTICGGKATGIAIGGNLSLIVSLLGTKYDIDWTGKIIYLEEIGEYPYRIDRMLTQLFLAGKFDNVAGIVFGILNSCDIDGEKVKREDSLSLNEILTEKFSGLGKPCVHGFSFGHIKNQAVFPYGINAEFDADKQTFVFTENPTFSENSFQ